MSEQVHEEERHEGNGHDAEKQPEPRKDPKKARRNKIIAIAAVANITAVSSRVPGTVVAVHVEDNQQIKAGDLLIELDQADLQVSLSSARAAVALAQAQLEAEQPGVPITQTSNRATVQSAQDEVANSQADLEAARKDLDQAVARDKFAQQQKQRGQMLLTAKTIPQADYDQRVSAADAAAAAVAAARQRVDQRRARLTTAQARFSEARANAPRQLSARQAGLSVREANLELAQAQFKQAEGSGRSTSAIASSRARNCSR
ncbi:MAG: biotin/lipoyl-binding protein [Deltaproteobacteria bacterium]|nr:MAG: biotin/lipoyl-binding protein [Deltaproteobacteria bacterium]